MEGEGVTAVRRGAKHEYKGVRSLCLAAVVCRSVSDCVTLEYLTVFIDHNITFSLYNITIINLIIIQ